jgi:hypothetical protein
MHDHALDARPSGHVGWHGVGVGGLCQIRAVHVAQKHAWLQYGRSRRRGRSTFQRRYYKVPWSASRNGGRGRQAQQEKRPRQRRTTTTRARGGRSLTSTPAGTMRTRPRRRGASGGTKDIVSMGSGNRRRACRTAGRHTARTRWPRHSHGGTGRRGRARGAGRSRTNRAGTGSEPATTPRRRPKDAEEQRAMFAASRAVAEGDLQAAYRIACGAPRPMARHILEVLQKLHPAPGNHLPEGQTPYGPSKRGVPKHIPITVDMSTLETVLGDLSLRSAAEPTGWTYRLIRDLGDRDDFKHATLKIVGLIAQGAVGLGDLDGERG